MIEARAVVCRVADGAAWVRPLSAEHCARCQEGRGCGGGMINRLVSSRRPEVEVSLRRCHPQVGETVVIGVEEGALVRAALAAYAVPLAGLVMAGSFAHLLLEAHELLVAAFGLLGMVGGFVVTRIISDRTAALPDARPVVLRRDAGGPDCAIRG